MTDQQLYLAIGVPIIANAATMLLGFTLMSTNLNKRVDDLSASLNKRLDDFHTNISGRFDLMDKIFALSLSRVEEVIDARLKHIEER